jgi:two-component system, OmpR family, phosphate regulon sensor histidine kinase PhoR
MDKGKVNSIIVLASIALLGLIAIQMYWIDNAITLAEQHFDQSVNEALTKVVFKIEKQKTAAKITKRFNFRTQGIRLTSQQDSLSEKNNFSLKKDNINVKIYEEYSSDSNGVIVKNTRHKNYTSDSALTRMDLKSEMVVPDYIQHFNSSELKSKSFSKDDNMVNDIFDELVSINIYNGYSPAIDTSLLDSIIRAELLEKGVTANYIFGVTESKKLPTETSGLTSKEILLHTSKYMINLSPDNVFIKPQYLSVHFPGQKKYVLRSLFFMLSVSGAFMIVIIFSFYYTVSTIFKQKKLSEIKNDFISNMTHEFKTPISTISLACEMLSDKTIEKSAERSGKYIKMIGDENKRLSILVENILQTAILDKGEFKLKIQSINIHNLIEQTIDNIKLQVENKEGEIVTQLNANEPIINADRVHITNIVFNLIDNALKYSNEKPKIIIRTENNGTGILISVNDNGIGISKENQKRVFDTMFRVHTGNIHNVKGFGLGLSYVKAIVEKHGGNVTLDSEVEQGSTFTIYLPANLLNS